MNGLNIFSNFQEFCLHKIITELCIPVMQLIFTLLTPVLKD